MTTITAEDSRALLAPLTGYTPGPWVVGDPSRMDEVEVGPDRWLHPGEGEYGRTPCAVVDICDDDPERIANCHLIAASPDLAVHLHAALDREAALLQPCDQDDLHFVLTHPEVVARAMTKLAVERNAARALIRDVTDRLWEIASGDMSAYDLIDHINAVLGQEPGT